MTRLDDNARANADTGTSRDDRALIDAIAGAWSPPRPAPGERLAFRERVIGRAARSRWRLLPEPAGAPGLLIVAALAALLLVHAGLQWLAPAASPHARPSFATSEPGSWERDLFDPPELDVWGFESARSQAERLPADYAAIESAFL